MPSDESPADDNVSAEICTHAADVARCGDILWAEYKQHGPSELPAEVYDEFEAAAKALGELLEEADDNSAIDHLRSELETLDDLAYRCRYHPQGLNFISGEAGLVSRKDLHEAMERALTCFRECR